MRDPSVRAERDAQVDGNGLGVGDRDTENQPQEEGP